MADVTAISRRSFLIAPVALGACSLGAGVVEQSGQAMGTTYNVVAVDPTRTLGRDAVRRAVETAVAQVNAQMSNWDPNSEVSRFNAWNSTEPMPVSAALTHVMTAAQEVHEASQGQFDVAVGPLIDAWGFGAGARSARAPSDAAISAALERSGQGRTIRVGDGTLSKTRPDAEVYLSAIGKGYGVDRVAQALDGLGLRNYMIEIGGDLYARGRNPDGQSWRIGIDRPDAVARGVETVAGVSDLGMATSGDYRNFFVEDGVRYSHVIDPRTGRPITHSTVSATVLAENAMLADAWATAMLVLGRQRGLRIAEARNLAVLFIDRDGAGPDSPHVMTQSPRFAQLQA